MMSWFKSKRKKQKSSYYPSREMVGHLNEENLREWYSTCQDITIKWYSLAEHSSQQRALFIYHEFMCDTNRIMDYVLPELRKHFHLNEIRDLSQLGEIGLFEMDIVSQDERQRSKYLTRAFDGDLIIYFPSLGTISIIKVANPPKRNPEEPNTEVSVRGPRDGFVEEIGTNVALIRKRIKSNALHYEQYEIGNTNSVKIGLFYIDGVAPTEVIQEVKQRLNKIEADTVLSSTHLEELLGNENISLFPMFEYTGRPDFAVNSLLHGRFALVVNGSPTVIMAPVNFTYLINTAEDLNSPFIYVIFSRFLRVISLMLAMFLPGFWLAVIMYHQDQLPYTFLTTLVLSRQGVPFPAALEMVILIFFFEVFREAGVRLPAALGQTLSVVGGLIIGQAAISAGLTAPGTLVIVAISVISSFTLVNQSLIGTVSVIRLLIIFCSSFLGMFGYLLSFLVLIVYLSRIHSFGIPYLSPVSPFIPRDFVRILMRAPWKFVDPEAKILEDKTFLSSRRKDE